jgi:hypothetical protein
VNKSTRIRRCTYISVKEDLRVSKFVNVAAEVLVGPGGSVGVAAVAVFDVDELEEVRRHSGTRKKKKQDEERVKSEPRSVLLYL